MTIPSRREQLGDCLNRLGLTGEMAEVGCAYGGFAEIVLKTWQGQRYWMIDPWAQQDFAVYPEPNCRRTDFELWYEQCRGLAERDPRVRLLRALSPEAAGHFADGQLDC